MRKEYTNSFLWSKCHHQSGGLFSGSIQTYRLPTCVKKSSTSFQIKSLIFINSGYNTEILSWKSYTALTSIVTPSSILETFTASQWCTQEFCLGRGGPPTQLWPEGREIRDMGGGSPPSQEFRSIFKWVKPVFLLGCYRCISHWLGIRLSSIKLRNFGGWGLNPPSPRYTTTASRLFFCVNLHNLFYFAQDANLKQSTTNWQAAPVGDVSDTEIWSPHEQPYCKRCHCYSQQHLQSC
jgi:hypothetical protein